MPTPLESQNIIVHLGDQVDPSDLIRIVLGYYDKNSNQFVPGLVSSVADLEKSRKGENSVGRYLLYFIAVLLAIEFMGLSRVSDIIRLVTGH